MSAYAPTGVASLGEVPWGSHVCQFFSAGSDLRDILVPYFKAGLENNERCLMVAMEPFTPEDARSALRAAVSDFDMRERRGQIEIHDVRAWYNSDSVINGEEIVAGLLASEQRARADGYNGFRTHGNIGWLGRNQWHDFQDYEAGVTRALRGRRMVSMCSYCLDNCTSQDVLDVVNRHSISISRKSDGWSCVAVGPHESGAGSHAIAAQTAEQRLLRVLESLPAAVYTTDKDGYLTYFNEAAAALWGYRPEIGKQRWCGTFKIVTLDGAVVPHDQCPMAVTGQPAYGIEVYAERPDGTRIPCAPFPTPILDPKGDVVGGINMLVDISQQKAIQDRQSILVRELDHRIKNNLATIQAIAGSTARNSRTVEEFQQAFMGRIAALSKTHDLLTESDQRNLPLRQLLDSELAIYDDGRGERIQLTGPEIVLPAHIAVPFGMTIHELTTNALKYGALSALGGRLIVCWKLDGTDLTLDWDELNVSIATQPSRAGFGTQLLQRLLPHQLGANVDMKFEPDGLKARISINLQ